MAFVNFCKSVARGYNNSSLILRIIIGMLVGIVLALVVPTWTWISVFGDLFVGALRGIAPILVFFLILSSLARAHAGMGKRFVRVIALYLSGTFLASLCAVIASFAFPQTIQLAEQASQDAPSGIGEVISNLLMNVVSNPVDALLNANYIGILAWAICLGIIMRKVATETTKTVFSNISDAISTLVRWIINLAPFGIMGLVFDSVSTNGLDIFINYGKLVLLIVCVMLFVAFVVEPLLSSLVLRRNAWPLVLRCLKDSGITAFFTRSSAANIPVNMRLCSKLGLDQEFYSVSIPLGATINMCGAAVTIAIMSLTAANTLGIAVDFPSAVILCLLSTIGACGASGVAGGSLLLIPMACSLFGISNDIAMQVVGVGFIIGVIQDSLETALNSSGDVIFTATAEYREWLNQGRELPKFFGPDADEYAGMGDTVVQQDFQAAREAVDAKKTDADGALPSEPIAKKAATEAGESKTEQ
jgi:serine/threonine transporter